MKVGDYVRTNDGYINKIKKVNQWNVLVDARDLFGEEINIANNEIIKSSPNIIDLIQVGDYVNGWRVMEKNDDYFFVGDENEGTWHLLLEDIKSIVTKESMESVTYYVK